MDTEDDQGPAIGTTGARFGGAPRRRRTRRKAAEADIPAEPADPAPEADTEAVPVTRPSPVPRVGARYHGAPAQTSAEMQAEPPAGGVALPGTASNVEGVDGAVVGSTGARFGGGRKKRKPRPGPAHTPPPRPETPPEQEAEEPVAGGSAFVRPYVFTRGRTRSAFQLSIETLVSAVPQTGPASLSGEHQAVLGLCREPRSVAELAARVGVPLAVARVLVGDLAAAGAVAVHRGAGAEGPDLALMQRVLSGLKRL